MKTGHHSEHSHLDFQLCTGVYLGSLMSPADVRRATAGHGEDFPVELYRWTLCGEMDHANFLLLGACGHPQKNSERLTVFEQDPHHHCAVFTHQAGSFQHRFLVPLYDPKAAEFLRAVAHGDAMGYSLAGQGSQAAVWATTLGASELMPLLPLCGESMAGREPQVLRDYVEMVMRLRDPGCIQSDTQGITVKFASVSAIAPDRLLDRIAGLILSPR